jgi:RNA polymerase sigma factor (sigma-70 family)
MMNPLSTSPATEQAPIDIEKHFGLAHLVCKPYKSQTGRSFSYEDLFQAACEGLLRAAKTYDPAKGAFSTYAIPLMRKYVRRLVATQSRTVKVPQYAQDAAQAPRPEKVDGGRTRRVRCGGAFDWNAPGASASNGAPLVGRAVAGFMSPLPYMGPPAAWAPTDASSIHSPGAEWSLDAPTGEDGAGTMHDTLGGAAPSDADDASDLIRIDRLAARAPELTDAERFVIQSRLVGISQPEIAGYLGVTKARVGQIQASGTEKLARKVKKP